MLLTVGSWALIFCKSIFQTRYIYNLLYITYRQFKLKQMVDGYYVSVIFVKKQKTKSIYLYYVLIYFVKVYEIKTRIR